MPTRVRFPLCATVLFVAACGFALPARGQVLPFPSAVPGVWIEQDGNVKSREVDQTKQLAALRARAKSAAQAAKDERLTFVSLPNLFAEVRSLVEANKPVPDALRYLGGLTQVRYVFVYPGEKDLVIAGPAEPFDVHEHGLYATGKRTGRPVMQLDDLVTALRTAADRRGQAFGCRIDPDPKSLEISKAVMEKYARKSRRERMDAMARELGPQKVSVFGTAADTRLAFVCVAADYKLKRFAMGLEPAASQATGVGHAVDSSRSAMNRFWFEASFEPLRVSPGGDAFELRGQRLKVQAGAFDFDPRGATKTAMEFAKRFNDKIPALAVAEPLIAELQNVADLSLLATLVRHDKLDRKAGWDSAWVLDGSASGYPVKKVPSPVTADTLVSATAGSIAAGGVMMSPSPFVAPDARQPDAKGELNGPRRQAMQLRTAEPAGAGGGVWGAVCRALCEKTNTEHTETQSTQRQKRARVLTLHPLAFVSRPAKYGKLPEPLATTASRGPPVTVSEEQP
jgi:hypothetical protein